MIIQKSYDITLRYETVQTRPPNKRRRRKSDGKTQNFAKKQRIDPSLLKVESSTSVTNGFALFVQSTVKLPSSPKETGDDAVGYFTQFVNDDDFLRPVRDLQTRLRGRTTLLEQEDKKSEGGMEPLLNQEIADIVFGIVIARAMGVRVDMELVFQEFLQALDDVLEQAPSNSLTLH